MKEIWKDIEGYEGKYQVSNLGRVKLLNYRHTCQERLLKLTPNKKGYLYTSLFKDGKRKQYQAHRLVAQAFIENSDNKPCIDHINTIRTDNRVNNLRWVTHKENCNNPLTREHYKVANTGKNIGKTIEKNIGNQYASKKVFCESIIYDSLTQCAEYYNVPISTMGKWLTGYSTMPADFQAKGLRYYIEE